MRATLRTILVIVAGIALSLVLYIAADVAFGRMVNADGSFNTNYSALIATWKTLGGTAGPIVDGGGPVGGGRTGGLTPQSGGMDARGATLGDRSEQDGDMPRFPGSGGGGMSGGFGALGLSRRAPQPVDISHGFDPNRAPKQTGSDLVWLAIPALIGAAIEIDATLLRKRRQKKAATAE